jgi:hypothetical protein
MFTKLAGFLLLLLAFGTQQARADSVYEIRGTLTIPGNSANPGIAETINYSFELDYTKLDNAGFASFVGTPSVTSFGPLGTFAIVNNSSQGYIGFFSPVLTPQNQPAQIDLLGEFSPLFNPVPVISGQAWLYSCTGESTGVCAPFFIGPGNIYGPATASVYAVSTPEPGTLCLFGLGALALCLMKKTLTH